MKTKRSFFGKSALLAIVVIALIFGSCPEEPAGSESTVETVTVSPDSPSIALGGQQQFSATVTGKNNPVQTVTWSVSGNDKPETVINPTGLLSVAADETSAALTVRATSTFDTSKSGTATVTVLSDGNGIPPEEKTTEELWDSWADPASGVTITHSVANDGVVTVTVGGTAVSDRWKADAQYQYTVQKDTTYTYVFEAWTAPGYGNRTLNVQYYGGGDIIPTVGPPYLGKWQVITEERQTYTITGTITGNPATNSGVTLLQFQCADQLGTFYVKVISITQQTDGSISDFIYSEDSSTITITGYTGASDAVEIPSTINGKPVVSIGDNAFGGDYIEWSGTYTGRLTSVTIPDSVTTIGAGAFVGNRLTSVTIPNSVTTIGQGAFGANQLTSVTIGNSVTTIGDYAFQSNQLTGVTIPDSVTTIGNYAFASNQLTSVTIGNSVTSIGIYAFVLNRLTSVTIPNSVTTIEQGAFGGNQLTSVTIGNSVTTIGNSAFGGNPLTNVSVDSGNTAYIAKNSFLLTIDEKMLLYYYGSEKNVTIPDSVTAIGDYAFSSNELTGVTIPDSVTTIGDRAFSNNKLTSVTIGNSVTTIGYEAFLGNQLTSVTIPNSVTSIGEAAFYNNQLTSVTIGNSVTTIGGHAFDDNQLTSVTIGANVTISSYAFPGNFYTVYNDGGKEAGTYTCTGYGNNSVWSKEED